MALQYGVTLRNNQLDQFEITAGTSAKLQFRTGAQPADCATADSGTLLCEITLPSDWMNAASSGSKTKTGTWSGTGAAAGNAAHFRLKDSAGTTCHAQGTVTATGGGGDMTMDNVNIAVSQTVTTNTFTLSAGNA
jgi:hypothetical protein